MADWYEKALKEFIFDLAYENELTEHQAKTAYSWLVNKGMIDYDVEKDILFDLYVEDDLEDYLGDYDDSE